MKKGPARGLRYGYAMTAIRRHTPDSLGFPQASHKPVISLEASQTLVYKV